MTYDMFKSITKGLLVGDNVLPTDDEVLLGLLDYALTSTAMKADSMHLMTLSTTDDVLRLAQGDYLIRRPKVPEDGVDELDIDEELVFAVARFVASYLSKDKAQVHLQAAARIILDYNAKTWEAHEQMEAEAFKAGVADVCYAAPDTEWTI